VASETHERESLCQTGCRAGSHHKPERPQYYGFLTPPSEEGGYRGVLCAGQAARNRRNMDVAGKSVRHPKAVKKSADE